MAEARQAAEARTRAARVEIEKQAAAAKSQLQGQAESLAQQVIDRVLHASAGGVR
jgi:hypothetical protein